MSVSTSFDPMSRSSRATSNATLEWTRRSLFASLHELRAADGRIVATLTYHGLLRTRADVEQDGRVRFRLQSSWTEKRLTAQDEADHPIAEYHGHWLGGGDLRLENDPTRWQWRPLSWTRRNWALYDEHVPVVQFRSRLALIKRRVQVSFSRENFPDDERLLVAAIGYYLVLAHRSRAH